MRDELLPSLLPAENPTGAPRERFFAFDTAESGIEPLDPPWDWSAFEKTHKTIAGYTEPPQLAVYEAEFSTLYFYDADAHAGVQWAADATRMSPGEGGATMRHFFRWALGAFGVNLIHAAAVGGALICGPSGAGKSTTSLVCALAGLPFTSDDYSLLSLENGEPRAHALYAYAKATPESLELVPEIADFAAAARRDWRGKLRLEVADRITRSQPISCVVIPVRAERSGWPDRLAPREALRRIVAANLLIFPGATRRTLTAVTELVRSVPVYELPIGPDIEGIPAAIESVATGSVPA